MEDKYVEMFIDLVRERKPIWSKRVAGYKDARGVKANNYKDILQELVKAYPDATVPFTGNLRN